MPQSGQRAGSGGSVEQSEHAVAQSAACCSIVSPVPERGPPSTWTAMQDRQITEEERNG